MVCVVPNFKFCIALQAAFVVILITTLAMPAHATSNPECSKVFGEIGTKAATKKSIRAQLETLTDNPQIQIWNLEESGNRKLAARLKSNVEKILSSAPTTAVDEEIYNSASIARNKPFLMTFEGGIQGVWKPWNKYTRKELTAYRFDQKLGSNLVPIVVERTHKGQRGVIQLFVRETDDAALVQRPLPLDLFDHLIAHIDRTDVNHLSFRGRTVAIDNEDTFGIDYYIDDDFFDFDRMMSDHLHAIGIAKDKEAAKLKAANQIAPTLISREVVEKLKTISDRQWRATLSDLDPAEFQLFLDRKNQAVGAIRAIEKVLGDRIYPVGPFSGLARNRWPGRLDQLTLISERPDITRALEKKILRAQDLLVNETSWRKTMTSEEQKELEAILKELDALP